MWVDAEWFAAAYDRAVTDAGTEGLTVKDARETVALVYQAAIQTGELERNNDLFDEGLGLFDRFVKPERQSRKAKLPTEMENIVAALNDATILGRHDPLLALAFPLGDGRDKTLLLWTDEDWRNAAMMRYRKAAEATAAAAIFDELSTQICHAMRSRAARNLGDCFPGEADAAS